LTPDHARWIKAACDQSLNIAPEDIADGLGDGQFVLFGNDKAVLVAEIDDFPLKQRRVCDVVVSGGNLDELLYVIQPQVEQWARDNACTHTRIEGRVGWRRVLKDHGYVDEAVCLAKRL
jgi:hypothetical protein